MPGDAVSIAPHVYSVVLENDRVRVLEVRMKPGQTSAMHSHPDVVVIAATSAKYRFTHPEGDPLEVEVPANAPMYMEAVEHSVEHIGDAEGISFLIELK